MSNLHKITRLLHVWSGTRTRQGSLKASLCLLALFHGGSQWLVRNRMHACQVSQWDHIIRKTWACTCATLAHIHANADARRSFSLWLQKTWEIRDKSGDAHSTEDKVLSFLRGWHLLLLLGCFSLTLPRMTPLCVLHACLLLKIWALSFLFQPCLLLAARPFYY